MRPAGGDFEIFLPINAAVPDRDFVLRWRRAARPDLLPVAWISSDQEATYALIQLRAPDDVAATTREGTDIYFLVDRSGSMAGEKWTKTAEALTAFVKSAAQRCWMPRVCRSAGSNSVPPHVSIFAIDRRAVLKEIHGRAIPVHCFGIDHAVNEAFLRQLSGQQRGTGVFLTPDDDLVRPVAILGSRLSRPVFTGLTLGEGLELAGTELPDMHSGQVVFAPIRAKGNLSEIIIVGKNATGRSLTVTLQAQAVKTDLPKLLWMKRRIDSFLQVGKDEEAIALAKKANLVCRGAAFIAWDDAEKVAIAQNEVYQPSLDAPGGVLYGRPALSIDPASQLILEREAPEYRKPVGGVFQPKETKRLTEQLRRILPQVVHRIWRHAQMFMRELLHVAARFFRFIHVRGKP